MWSQFWIKIDNSSKKITSLEAWTSLKEEINANQKLKADVFKQNKHDKSSHIPEFGHSSEHTGILLVDFLLTTNDFMDKTLK
jgi:hypothetical protein